MAAFAQTSQALRSRSTSFGSLPKEAYAKDCPNPRKSKSQPSRPPVFKKVSGVYKLCLLCLSLLAVVSYWEIWPVTFKAPLPAPNISHERHSQTSREKEIDYSVLRSEPLSTPRKVPLVDRSILQRLAELELSPDPDERPYFASSHRWPPIVTRIPEARRPVVNPDICGDGQRCRFLLPLRIAEQESKARIHFMELLQLAQKLDRILVLPNVGKSRVGACFKFEFEMYYDLERLTEELEAPHTLVKQQVFRRWVEATAPSGRLVFLSATPDPSEDPPTFSNDGVTVRVGAPGSNTDLLPGCYPRFHALRLDGNAPLHVHLKTHTHTWPIDASILGALTRPDIRAAASPMATSDPTVLVFTWDLRYPIFQPRSALPRLHYAPRLQALAALLAPPAPYVMVHWRMESVSPDSLLDCAHALVDTLARLPSSLHGSSGIRSLWFASDYPYAVHRRALPGQDYGAFSALGAPAADVKAKSGTFRDLGPQHGEAVGILGDAFAEGGELEGWEIAELTEARVAELNLTAAGHGGWDAELLEDVGAHGIVDKIIGMRAALFISGATGCARASSFTKQIVDERQAALRRGETGLQNLVEHFG